MAWLQLKGEQLSGSAYYFNGCKALMFSSVVHFNQATRQLSTWVKATVSSIGPKDGWGSSCSGLDRALSLCAVIPSSPVWDELGPPTKKKKKNAVNWIWLWQGNPRPDQGEKKRRKKNYSKMPSFAGARERKDRCLISFSVRAAGLRGVDLWRGRGVGGGLLMFAFCQSVCVCAEKYFWLLFFSNRGERN